MAVVTSCSDFEAPQNKPRQHIKKQRHYFANKSPSSQCYGFPVVMYRCESSTIKKAQCWRIDAFELWYWRRLLRLQGDQTSPSERKSDLNIHWIDAKDETLILWPPDAKSWLIWKDPDAGEDWRQEENGTTEDEMVGWHHRLNGHEFEQALGGGDGQGSLACCSPWVHKESGTTEQPNWIELTIPVYLCTTSSLLIHLSMDI